MKAKNGKAPGGMSEQEMLDKVDPSPEMVSVRRQLQEALADNKRLKAEVGTDERLVGAIRDSIESMEPYRQIPIPKPILHHAPMEAALILTDAHSEELVRAEEVEGLGEYNWNIFTQHMRTAAEKTIELVNIQRQASEITRLSIWNLGDWFLGSIHPDDTGWGNSMPLPIALPKAAQVCADLHMRLAAHFDEVRAVGMCGNHGRDTRRKVTKMTADRNWDYSLYMIAQAFSEKAENLTWDLPKSRVHVLDIMGWKAAITHGDLVRITSRTPYFAIEDTIKGEHMSRRRTDKDFDYAFMGHFHHEAMLRGEIMLCPPMIGQNQYGQYNMHAKSPAKQMLIFFTEKYGWTWQCPINL